MQTTHMKRNKVRAILLVTLNTTGKATVLEKFGSFRRGTLKDSSMLKEGLVIFFIAAIERAPDVECNPPGLGATCDGHHRLLMLCPTGPSQ